MTVVKIINQPRAVYDINKAFVIMNNARDTNIFLLSSFTNRCDNQ